jgi:hypothetical protein
MRCGESHFCPEFWKIRWNLRPDTGIMSFRPDEEQRKLIGALKE